jgi:hypothetical protein
MLLRWVQHQEDVMTRIALDNANGTLPRRFGLTENEIFRLWRTAIKDDDKLVDEAIQKVYDDMISFDRGRAEMVISLIIRRNREAGHAFRSLLRDMREHRGANLERAA